MALAKSVGVTVLMLIAFSFSGCDFPCGAPDGTEMEVELWQFYVVGPGERRVINDVRDRGSRLERGHYYDLVGSSPADTLLYYTHRLAIDTTSAFRARNLVDGDLRLFDFMWDDSHFRMSPDRSRVAFIRLNSEVWVAEIDGSGARKLIDVPGAWITDLQWADDEHVAVASHEGGVRLVPIDGEDPVELTSTSVGAFSVAPDLQSIAYIQSESAPEGYNITVAYVQNADGKIRLGEALTSQGATDILFVDRGRQVVFVGRPAGEVILVNSDGSNPRTVGSGRGPLVVDPAGEPVVFRDNFELNVLDITTARQDLVIDSNNLPPDRQWDSTTHRIESMVFSEDGQSVFAIVHLDKYSDPCN